MGNRPERLRSAVAALVLAVAASAACDDNPLAPDDISLETVIQILSLEIVPQEATRLVGDSIQLTVDGPAASAGVRWLSDDFRVATVDATGKVSACARGKPASGRCRTRIGIWYPRW